MQSSEEILQNAARDGSIDIAEWPRVLESLLLRLHEIVHNDFPLPFVPQSAPTLSAIDPEVVASTPPQLQPSEAQDDDHDLSDAESENVPPPNSQSSTKENDAPVGNTATSPPPLPAFRVNHSMPAPLPAEDGGSSVQSPLPPDLLGLYTSSTRILSRDFATSPPYTIQRLAELILHPKKHYRFLPAFLRALDRIISISSPVSHFPLPALHTVSNGGFLTNGDTQMNGMIERDGLGSDESLGGALLTPIPWLKPEAMVGTAAAAAATANQNDGELRSESTETIDGPNGAGSIETVTVTVNGVPSASSLAHTSPAPVSPTLSEQSDASSSSSSGGGGGGSGATDLAHNVAVTQGELLRQEQEAGVIPVTHPPPRRTLLSGGGSLAVGREPLPHPTGAAAPVAISSVSADIAMSDEDTLTLPADEPAPHARGPDLIGMEDTGPQPFFDGGLDMEAAVGRRSKSPQPPPASEEQDGQPEREVEKDVERLREAMDVEEVEGDGNAARADVDR